MFGHVTVTREWSRNCDYNQPGKPANIELSSILLADNQLIIIELSRQKTAGILFVEFQLFQTFRFDEIYSNV